MSTFIIVIAITFGLVGIVGSVLPVLPGPPISWLGMLVLYIWGRGTDSATGAPMSTKLLIVWLVITIIVTVIDYLVPAWITKTTGGSRYASRGALAGMLVGLFFTPVGILIGTIAGAFLAEMLFNNQGLGQSIKSAFGAFLGFILGTGLKLTASGIMFYYIIVYMA